MISRNSRFVYKYFKLIPSGFFAKATCGLSADNGLKAEGRTVRQDFCKSNFFTFIKKSWNCVILKFFYRKDYSILENRWYKETAKSLFSQASFFGKTEKYKVHKRYKIKLWKLRREHINCKYGSYKREGSKKVQRQKWSKNAYN